VASVSLKSVLDLPCYITYEGDTLPVHSSVPANNKETIKQILINVCIFTVYKIRSHVIFVTQVGVHYLICTHDARGHAVPEGECVHIRQCTVLQLICYTFKSSCH